MKKIWIYLALLTVSLTGGYGQVLAVPETWESSLEGPFNGLGDLIWVGDTGSFEIANSTWPTGPDFDGARSLRSNSNSGGTASTVVTEISNAFDPLANFSWSVFASGNAASITSSKRVDMILLSDSNSPSSLESPSSTNGYKLSLWDPLASGGEGHAGAALGDSLSLWKVTSSDTEWQLVDAHEFGSSVNVNLGWNLSVTRSVVGEWNVSFANGALGTPLGVPVITVVDNSVPLTGDTWYSGLGLLTTTTDAVDFGFDNFTAVGAPIIPEPSNPIPEPSSLLLLASGLAGLAAWRRRNAA